MEGRRAPPWLSPRDKRPRSLSSTYKAYSRQRQGVEIDYCPPCRDEWLDHGEPDTIIERGSVAASAPLPNKPPMREQLGYAHQPGYPQQHGYSKHGYPKRKKSFPEELFD